MEFLRDNWISLIFIGIMVYMMFKGGGCCGGHAHGSHDHKGESYGEGEQHQHNVQLDEIKDPVCGMTVNPDTAIKQMVNGKVYYFCSESCRSEFVKRQT